MAFLLDCLRFPNDQGNRSLLYDDATFTRIFGQCTNLMNAGVDNFKRKWRRYNCLMKFELVRYLQVRYFALFVNQCHLSSTLSNVS